MANLVIGTLMMMAGVALGLYVGVYLMLIGGIVQLVAAIKGGFVASGIAWGIAKIIFAGGAGLLSAICLIIPGYFRIIKE